MEEPDLELDDIREQAELVGALTPIEFARLNSMAPQQIYKWIREGHIKTFHCQCGRKVVNVEDAQAVVNSRRRKGIVEVTDG